MYFALSKTKKTEWRKKLKTKWRLKVPKHAHAKKHSYGVLYEGDMGICSVVGVVFFFNAVMQRIKSQLAVLR